MSDYRKWLQQTAPTSLLTLSALVQAIALERLVQQVSGLSDVDASIPALVGCVAAAVMVLEGIVIIWILNAQVFCVIRWVPIRSEPFWAFGFGLLQFTTIALLEPATLWIGMLVYGTATAGAVPALRRTIREWSHVPENARALAGLPLDRVLRLSLVHGGLCALAGIVGAWSETGLSVLVILTMASNAAILASWSTGWWRVVQEASPSSAL